jgi:hypothetical protein
MNISAILHTRELTPRLFSRPAKQSWTYNPSDALSATPVLYLFLPRSRFSGGTKRIQEDSSLLTRLPAETRIRQNYSPKEVRMFHHLLLSLPTRVVSSFALPAVQK